MTHPGGGTQSCTICQHKTIAVQGVLPLRALLHNPALERRKREQRQMRRA